jgi:hypothetical protein
MPEWICTDARISKAANLQDAERRSQVGSGFPSHAPVGAQDWGQVLTFEDKNGPHFKAFTIYFKQGYGGPNRVSGQLLESPLAPDEAECYRNQEVAQAYFCKA